MADDSNNTNFTAQLLSSIEINPPPTNAVDNDTLEKKATMKDDFIIESASPNNNTIAGIGVTNDGSINNNIIATASSTSDGEWTDTSLTLSTSDSENISSIEEEAEDEEEKQNIEAPPPLLLPHPSTDDAKKNDHSIDEPVQQIILLGERHSGTNWITDYLTGCFDIKVRGGEEWAA